ncbi:MAG: NVEALA domain-containing protein, partial [Bacteroides sp.]|nr:NVEALA domain-containing protein [Bacteroides sp.]
FALVAAVAAIGGYGVYTNQKAVAMSDLMLENIEALAKIEDSDEGGVVITCSRTCSDGVGRCYKKYDDWGNCHFSGDQSNFCTCG